MLLLNHTFLYQFLCVLFFATSLCMWGKTGRRRHGGCGAAVPRYDHTGLVGAAAVLMKLEMHSNNECGG